MLFLLFFFFITTCQSSLLSDHQIHAFIRTHELELERCLPRAHRAYQAMAVAYQKIQENPFEGTQKMEAPGYYSRVIISLLHGVGFGGISKTHHACEEEYMLATSALYTIGFNLVGTYMFEEGRYAAENTHFETCNNILMLGKTRIPSTFRTPYGDVSLAPSYTGAIKLDPVLLDITYDKEYLNALHAKRSAAVSAQFLPDASVPFQTQASHVGVGARSDLEKESGDSDDEDLDQALEPVTIETGWSGILYRDSAAAKESVRRGKSDPISQNTGCVKMRIKGKASAYNGTGSVIYQQSSFAYILTNAHCVWTKPDEEIESVEFEIPGLVLPLFIEEIFMHPEYQEENHLFDFAVLKAKTTTKFSPPPLLKENICISKGKSFNGYTVSYADVNYVDDSGHHVQKFKGSTRALSLQRVYNHTGDLRVFGVSYKIKTHDVAKIESAPVDFPAPSSKTHLLDACVSYGCSGSPFYVKFSGEDFCRLAGVVQSVRTSSVGSVFIRQSKTVNIFPVLPWIEAVTESSSIAPTVRLTPSPAARYTVVPQEYLGTLLMLNMFYTPSGLFNTA